MLRRVSAGEVPVELDAGPGTWSRRGIVWALVALAAAPALAGCRRRRPLRVAAHVWAGYELLFLAAREGWLSPRDVVLVETGSATGSLQALRDERVDAAALTLDEVLRARAEGLPLSVVLVVDVSSGADAVLVRPGVPSAPDLAGQRVGVEPSATGALMLHHLLRTAGLGPRSVVVVPVTPDRHVEVFRARAVDALVTFEPIATELEAEGAVRLFDSRDVPGAIVDVLAVRKEALPGRGREIRAALAGHFAARRHLVSNRQDAAHRMCRHLRLSAAQVLHAFRSISVPEERMNRLLLDGPRPGLLETARALSVVMVDAGLLRRVPALDDLVNPGFLPEEP